MARTCCTESSFQFRREFKALWGMNAKELVFTSFMQPIDLKVFGSIALDFLSFEFYAKSHFDSREPYFPLILHFCCRYLQEIGYTDTIIDIRSNRVR